VIVVWKIHGVALLNLLVRLLALVGVVLGVRLVTALLVSDLILGIVILNLTVRVRTCTGVVLIVLLMNALLAMLTSLGIVILRSLAGVLVLTGVMITVRDFCAVKSLNIVVMGLIIMIMV